MHYTLLPIAVLATTAIANAQDGSSLIESLLIPVSHTETKYNGVVGVGGCSGSLISGSNDNAPAYVLTAAHCFGIPDDVIIDGTSDAKVVTNKYGDRPDSLISEEIPVSVVRLATYNIMDIAVLELGTTVGALKAKNHNFYRVADTRPSPGAALVHVGFPGLRPMTRSNLVVQAAGRDYFTNGDNWEFAYVSTGAIMGGYSGSPNFDASNTIYGITTHILNDTTPISFGVDGLNGCFTPSGTFDFKIATCFVAFKQEHYKRFGVALPGLDISSVPTDEEPKTPGKGTAPDPKQLEVPNTPGGKPTIKANGDTSNGLVTLSNMVAVVGAIASIVAFSSVF